MAVHRLFATLFLVLGLTLSVGLAFARTRDGATMTVLAGQVAVIHSDGTALQPAPSGTIVYPQDEIRTLDSSGALITFFTGTEIELGEDTILVVEQVSHDGERVDVSLRQVFGVAINRVAALADTGSSYRVEAGGSVAVVRGTAFVIGVMPPFAGIGCAEGSVALEVVACQPGKLFTWEFDPQTGERRSGFNEKSIPAGDLGAALNAVVSALGDLTNLASETDGTGGHDDNTTATSGGSGGGSEGNGGGSGGSGGGPTSGSQCGRPLPDHGNSEEAHAVNADQPPGPGRGACISSAAHTRNEAQQGDTRGKRSGSQQNQGSGAKKTNGGGRGK